MIVKAARLGVPILVSRSSTTTLAISLADRLHITILGCLRAGGMIVYTHPYRLLAAE
jgi:FdhD protein